MIDYPAPVSAMIDFYYPPRAELVCITIFIFYFFYFQKTHPQLHHDNIASGVLEGLFHFPGEVEIVTL